MNPVPLKDPSGVVRAWMCGECLHVGGCGEYMGSNADEQIVEGSRIDAEHAASATTAGSLHRDPLPKPLMTLCVACGEKWQADCNVRHKAFVEEQRAKGLVEHDACGGIGCDGCDEEGWIQGEAR